MSDVTTAAPAGAMDKLQQAERFLSEVLRQMEVPARLEVKDMPALPAEGEKPATEATISVAIHFEGEVPGGATAQGKRNHVLDALQFLANKVVNRPNTERRWIALGVGVHPEPRPAEPPKRERGPKPPPAATGPNGGGPVPVPPRATRPSSGVPMGKGQPARAQAPRPSAPRPSAPRPAPAPDEASLEVSEDAELAAAARAMAEHSARHGRFYGVVAMKPEDRARVLKAAAGVEGCSVKAEGEGLGRRVVFTPAKPQPMPKAGGVPVDDDEDEDV